MKFVDWVGIGLILIGIICLIINILLVKETLIIPLVNNCPVVTCPVTSEVDCSKEVLDTINEAEVLKQTIRRIG